MFVVKCVCCMYYFGLLGPNKHQITRFMSWSTLSTLKVEYTITWSLTKQPSKMIVESNCDQNQCSKPVQMYTCLFQWILHFNNNNGKGNTNQNIPDASQQKTTHWRATIKQKRNEQKEMQLKKMNSQKCLKTKMKLYSVYKRENVLKIKFKALTKKPKKLDSIKTNTICFSIYRI